MDKVIHSSYNRTQINGYQQPIGNFPHCACQFVPRAVQLGLVVDDHSQTGKLLSMTISQTGKLVVDPIKTVMIVIVN